MMLTRDTCSVSYVTVFKIASITHTAFFLVFLSKASILNRFISNSQNFRKFSALKSESRYVLHNHQYPHVYQPQYSSTHRTAVFNVSWYNLWLARAGTSHPLAPGMSTCLLAP